MAKTARLEVRVKPEIYDILKYAANITGRSLSEFVVTTAYTEAKKIILEHSILEKSVKNCNESISREVSND